MHPDETFRVEFMSGEHDVMAVMYARAQSEEDALNQIQPVIDKWMFPFRSGKFVVITLEPSY